MKLIITEKPSVAKEIANVLGAKSHKDNYIEGNGYIISWCIGHLVGLAEANVYNEKYKHWEKEDLPIIPQEFKYTVTKDKQTQVNTLKQLMQREDVDFIVNACDSGREGELIFRLVYEYNNCKLPIKRLWISSLEEKAIKKGFDNLKDGVEYENLYKAALCRMHADWIVGINATRLFSILYDTVLNVGRVMSPTLSLIVTRDENIKKFIKEPLYTVETVINGFSFTHITGKLRDKQEAILISAATQGQPATVTNLEKINKSTSPPKLFDLTTLQREVNKLYGYTAQQTLDIAQKLYEKKLITYPRTDSRHLPSDIKTKLLTIAEKLNIPHETLNSVQVIDNTKVTDHHAIIPTEELPKELTDKEQNIYKLISVRFISSMSAKYEYAETTVTLSCRQHTFTGKAKMTVKNGFMDVEKLLRNNKNTQEEKTLPPLEVGQVIEDHMVSVKKGETTPPKEYTEDTLLASMETAGKDEVIEDAERKGLGTPATRAGIIEKLVNSKFVERQGKNLVPTQKGILLIKVIPQQLKSLLLTAEWENALKEVERGQKLDIEFKEEIITFISNCLESNQRAQQEIYKLFPREEKKRTVIGTCPKCKNADVVEWEKSYSCNDKTCKFVLWKDNKFFASQGKKLTKTMAEEFCKYGSTYVEGLKSKTGKTYSANVVLKYSGDYVNFELDFSTR